LINFNKRRFDMKKMFVLLCVLVWVFAAGSPAAAEVTGFVANPEGNSIDWQNEVEALGGIVNTNVNFDSHPSGLLQNDFYSASEGVTLAIEPNTSIVVNGQGPGQGNAWTQPLSEGEGVHAASNFLLIEGGSVSFTLSFATPVYGAGLFVIDYFDPWGMAPLAISAYRQDGSLLESYSAVQYNFQTDKLYFMGVTSSDGDIASVVFTAETSATMDLIGIDGIRFAAAEPDEEPEATVDGILQFFDDAVDDGTLQGSGKFEWLANLRLWLTRKTLSSAVKAVEQGHTRQALSKLEKVYRRCDGEKRPRDFVEGQAVAQLAEMIQTLKAGLDDESSSTHAHFKKHHGRDKKK
jgi:hypothetical protein